MFNKDFSKVDINYTRSGWWLWRWDVTPRKVVKAWNHLYEYVLELFPPSPNVEHSTQRFKSKLISSSGETTMLRISSQIWCGFDRASSLICGNKMPTRCNRGFYCRSYCSLKMFRTPLCPSLGAQECYTVVAACGISCCGFQVAGLVWSWGLCVRFAGCCSILQTGHITLS